MMLSAKNLLTLSAALLTILGVSGCFQGSGGPADAPGAATAFGMSAEAPSDIPANTESGSRGGVVSAATDTDGFGECDLDPTSEKCRENIQTATNTELKCTGDIPGIRLVYKTLSTSSGLFSAPCAWSYPQAVRPYIESQIEQNGSGLFYRDFCYSPDSAGKIEKFVADFPEGGFFGFYFKRPTSLPLQFSDTNLASGEDLAHMIDEAETEGSEFHFTVQLNEGVNKIIIPGGKYEDCSVYEEKKAEPFSPLSPLPPFSPTVPLKNALPTRNLLMITK